MAEKLLLVNLNLNGNMLKNVAVETLATAPANPVAGQFYVNSADGKFYYYNGTAWVAGAEYSASSKSAEGAIPVLDGTVGNDFQFKAVKGSGNLQVTESAGIITFSIDEADMAVSTAVQNAIDAAQAAAISTAASDATTKADAAEQNAKDYADEKVAAEKTARETAVSAEETRAKAAEAAAEQNAKDYADGKIESLDVTDAEVDGQFVVAVSETDGKISVSRKAVAADKVTYSNANTQAANVKAALDELYVASGAGAAVTMTESTGVGDAGKTYTFYQGGQDASHKIGEINVPKDLVLKSGEIRTIENVPHLILTLNDAASTEIDINLNDVFNDYAAGDSLELSNRTFNVVLDTNSEAFLTIDGTSHRLKLSGVQAAINTAKSEVIGTASDASSADTIKGAKKYAEEQAASAGTNLVGTASDASSADTIKGAKKYADEKAAAAEQNAKDYADGLKTTIDDYTVNGKKISTNPTISATLAQQKLTGAASGVTVTTNHPGSIKAFYNGSEVAVNIAYTGSVATLTWNGSYSLDIYYFTDVALS